MILFNIFSRWKLFLPISRGTWKMQRHKTKEREIGDDTVMRSRSKAKHVIRPLVEIPCATLSTRGMQNWNISLIRGTALARDKSTLMFGYWHLAFVYRLYKRYIVYVFLLKIYTTRIKRLEQEHATMSPPNQTVSKIYSSDLSINNFSTYSNSDENISSRMCFSGSEIAPS